MSLLQSFSFFFFCLFSFLFLYYNFAFFNEEFVIFISILYFFYILFSILKRGISKYFFFKMEYIYFSFLHLILVNLLLTKKLSNFISNFVMRSKMIGNSELFFVTSFVLHKVFRLHLANNVFLVKRFILKLYSNMFFQHYNLLLMGNNKNLNIIDRSLYFFFASLNHSMILFMCKKIKRSN